MIRRPFQELLTGHVHLDELIIYTRRRNAIDVPALARMARLYQKLIRGRFDLAIDLQGLLRSGLMTSATLAKTRVGLADAREGATQFYSHVVHAPRRGIHAVERTMKVAEKLGAPMAEPEFTVPIAEEDRRWAGRILQCVPSPRIILNVGARWPTKCWPPEHFAAIAHRASEEFGAGLIAVGATEACPLVDRLIERLPAGAVVDLRGRTRLMQLAALTAQADLTISNDSGPLHLAAAAGGHVFWVSIPAPTPN